MKIYFNIKTNYGVETVDELSQKDFSDYKSFRSEIKRLKSEYHLGGMDVYISQRCTKSWAQKA